MTPRIALAGPERIDELGPVLAQLGIRDLTIDVMAAR